MADDRAERGQRRAVRRDMGYGGAELDRGQVATLIGAPNDEKLVRLGYFGAVVRKGDDLHQCAECGSEFTGVAERTAHGDRRHRPPSDNPAEEDRRAEKRERQLEQLAPLHLDKTAAVLR